MNGRCYTPPARRSRQSSKVLLQQLGSLADPHQFNVVRRIRSRVLLEHLGDIFLGLPNMLRDTIKRQLGVGITLVDVADNLTHSFGVHVAFFFRTSMQIS